MYRTTSQAGAIRSKVVAHFRRNEDVYKSFVTSDLSRYQTRQHPRVRNIFDRTDGPEATVEEQTRTWERYLQNMARQGTFGSHLELHGFCKAFRRMVVVIHHDTGARIVVGDQFSHRPHYTIIYNVSPISAPYFINSQNKYRVAMIPSLLTLKHKSSGILSIIPQSGWLVHHLAVSALPWLANPHQRLKMAFRKRQRRMRLRIRYRKSKLTNILASSSSFRRRPVDNRTGRSGQGSRHGRRSEFGERPE